MANTLFPKGAEKMLSGAIDMTTATIKAVIVPSSYTYDSTDEFLSDLGTTLGTAVTTTAKTVTGGVFDCADITFSAVAGGSTAKAVVYYKDTGSAATSPVIYYQDTITGWPLATNGGDITVQQDSGAYKVFALVG